MNSGTWKSHKRKTKTVYVGGKKNTRKGLNKAQKVDVNKMIQADDKKSAENFTQSLTVTVQNNNVAVGTVFQRMVDLEDKAEIAIGSQTATFGDRDSNTVELHLFKLKGVITANASGLPDQYVRVIIISTSGAAVPDFGTILNGIVGKSTLLNAWERTLFRSPKDNSLSAFDAPYKLQYDQLHRVSQNINGPYGTERYFNVNLKFPKGHFIQYGTAAVADYQKGMFWITAIQNGSDANKPAVNYMLRYKYNT